MANVFLERDHSEIETAILLEKAFQTDIGRAVAFTDGNRVFINTDDNLAEILPDYNKGMLKWLLWHEEYHKQLKHHNRFFRYLDELNEQDTIDEFQVTKDEVNIIMDILVHDSLSKMFPDLVETAITNLAQMRNRNSLEYTFTTFNLEDMLDEYAKYKHKDDKDGKGTGSGGEDKDGEPSDEEEDGSKKKSKKKGDHKDGEEETSEGGKKGHSAGGGASEDDKKEDGLKEEDTPPEPKGEHDKTDWSKLEDIDTKEFIDKDEGDRYQHEIERLRKMKIKLGRITQTLNGLATSTKTRTYRMPNMIPSQNGIILKGKMSGKTPLYLVFDASGSMGRELAIFKDIISKSIPQAMECPCEWFSGDGERIAPNPKGRGYDYYKSKFKDILPVRASSGYDDDGDRTIELCLEAEKQGYSPIGVTDGGGGIYQPDVLKQLKKTILVGQNKEWLEKAKRINPNVQVLWI